MAGAPGAFGSLVIFSSSGEIGSQSSALATGRVADRRMARTGARRAATSAAACQRTRRRVGNDTRDLSDGQDLSIFTGRSLAWRCARLAGTALLCVNRAMGIGLDLDNVLCGTIS